jgi:hypothetical protein
MTITTTNSNPKNESKWARHRSIMKGAQNQLGEVIKGLKAQQGARWEQFDFAPQQLRDTWLKVFKQSLPIFRSNPALFAGSAGVAEWLGPNSPHSDDLNKIWPDFTKMFVRRADNNGTTAQLLFICCYTNPQLNSSNFDLIYSKWGLNTTGGHKFFHWHSVVGTQPKRATIDDFVDADDLGDEETDV